MSSEANPLHYESSFELMEATDKTIVCWAMRKYKKFKYRKIWASKFIQKIMKNDPKLFVHWETRMKAHWFDGSGMN